MNYGEHLRLNREHERDAFALLTDAERAKEWQWRKRWLLQELTRLVRFGEQVTGCPRCTGAKLIAHSWPTAFSCRSCSSVIILDRWLPDGTERVLVVGEEESVPAEFDLSQKQWNAVVAFCEALVEHDSFEHVWQTLGFADRIKGIDRALLQKSMNYYICECEGCGRARWQRWPVCLKCRIKMLSSGSQDDKMLREMGIAPIT